MKKTTLIISLLLGYSLLISVSVVGQQSSQPLVVTKVEPTSDILIAEQQPNFLTSSGWQSTGEYFRVIDTQNNKDGYDEGTELIWAEYWGRGLWSYLIYTRKGELVGGITHFTRPITFYSLNNSNSYNK